MNNTKKNTIKNTRLHVVLGAALLGLLVTPLAFAGAAEPVAGASKVTNAKFNKLKQRIAQLEQQAGQARPTGPAAGDLEGTYPAPTIGESALASKEIEDNTVGAADLAGGSVGIAELQNDTVGAAALKGIRVAHGNGASANGVYAEDTVTCAPSEQLIAGGYAWTSPGVAGTVTTTNAPSEGDPYHTWIVGGRAPAPNGIFAWAICIAS
jgi:hypothetical protein